MSKWGWTGLLVHGGALLVTCVAGLMLLEKVGPDGLWTAVQAYILVGLFYNLITAMVVGFFSQIRATRTQRLIAQCFTIAVLLSACGGVGGITLVQPSWYTPERPHPHRLRDRSRCPDADCVRMHPLEGKIINRNITGIELQRTTNTCGEPA